jgi:hypothetical protein
MAMAFYSLVIAAPALQAQPELLSDPMQPQQRPRAAIAAKSARPVQLDGVIVSPTRRIAVISGEFRREGDWIGGMQIERIERKSVVFRRGEEAVVIFVNSGTDAAMNTGELEE